MMTEIEYYTQRCFQLADAVAAALAEENAQLNQANHMLLDRLAEAADLEEKLAVALEARDLAQRVMATAIFREAALRQCLMGIRQDCGTYYGQGHPYMCRIAAALAAPSPVAEAMVGMVKAAGAWEHAQEAWDHTERNIVGDWDGSKRATGITREDAARQAKVDLMAAVRRWQEVGKE